MDYIYMRMATKIPGIYNLKFGYLKASSHLKAHRHINNSSECHKVLEVDMEGKCVTELGE